MDFETREFDAKSLHKTQEAWLKDLDSTKEISPVEVHKAIEFINEHAKYDDVNKELIAYGIFEGKKQVASAITNLVVSRTGRRMVKMLDLNIRPSIDQGAISGNLDASHAVRNLYVEAVFGTIDLTPKHGANTVKVYGRSAAFMEVLKAVAEKITERAESEGVDVKAAIEGRFLAIKF
ncbi:hypothetical protein [Herbaspirillum huttiense]|uniref:hypothetical protein n=1 Tax=Herbaspirillum huttiense TaxID=863372 RepID=UPI0031D68950